MKQYLTALSIFILLFLELIPIVSAQDSKPISNDEIRQLTLDSKLNNSNWFAETWKYHPGDKPEWADPNFDDSSWKYTTSTLSREQLIEDGWEGIGWFRLHVFVADEQLLNKPLALNMSYQSGAIEIYLDGELIYSLGKIGTTKEDEEPYWERDPMVITFSNKAEHVIAVRYSNYTSPNFTPILGFALGISPLMKSIKERVYYVRIGTTFQMVWTAITVFLMLQHLLLFFFYPRARENLFFAITTGSIGFFVFITFQFFLLATSVTQIQLLFQLISVFYVFMFLSALLFLYTLFYPKLPKLSWFFTIGWILTGSVSLLTINDSSLNMFGANWFNLIPRFAFLFLILLTLLTFLEMARVIIVAIFKRKDGAWIFGLGSLSPFLLPFLMSAIVSKTQYEGFIIYFSLLAIILAPLFSMSVYLARNFARTRRKLETEELERKLLEVENTRKTAELEEARTLQMSMLPQKPPELPYLNVAFKMQPASEVGGDYFDYIISDDSKLTIAIGDATGHGMNAGLVVSAVKSLFKTSTPGTGNKQILERISQGVKSMNLKRIYMAMTLATFNENRVTLTGAGMPTPLIYQAEESKIEEIHLQGMPLGGFIGTEREEIIFEVQSGDTVLLMSDGLPEMLNPNDEMLGYERTKELFGEIAAESTDEILNYMLNASTEWADGKSQEDDVTLVVIKVK